LVIAGTHSGVGKTTVATGLMAALRSAGHRPAPAKVGPDFIDPGYHALACSRPPRNLDAWLCGPDSIKPLAARAGENSDILVIEGVMGLFDGAADNTPSSTADIARMLDAPVVLVVDASAMSGSVAALVHGFQTYDRSIRLAGVVLNNVGSDGHATLLREALAPLAIPVLGALKRDDRMSWRDRHLGLVPVAERPDEVRTSLDLLSQAVTEAVDLRAMMAIAASAPATTALPVPLPEPPVPAGAQGALVPPDHPGSVDLAIAVAAGRAFTFTYTDTLDALRAGGATVVTFDPLHDEHLPDADGIIIGGGFPEVHASALAGNRPLLDDLHAKAVGGVPLWAECGGLLLLAESIDRHPMAGVIPARASMTDRLTLGYREATTNEPSPIGEVGTVFRGHEFHYSKLEPGGQALTISSRWGTAAEGWSTPTMLATYVHHHPGGDPGRVAAFLAACTLRRTLRRA
jgi:cobyrinic acid a,c-diamide synthase